MNSIDFNKPIKLLRPPPGFPVRNYVATPFISELNRNDFNFRAFFQERPVVYSDLNTNAREFVPLKQPPPQPSSFFDMNTCVDFVLEGENKENSPVVESKEQSFFDMDTCIDFVLEEKGVSNLKKKRRQRVFYRKK